MNYIFEIAILFALVSILFFFKNKIYWYSVLLFISAFLLRFHFIQLDPFLYDWDERYHAEVSKNMIADPLIPMLRAEAVLPYDYKAWTGNHIWVHKQPVFLWQMALSMKLFGVNEIAVRLPSALMSALLVFIIIRMGALLKKKSAGFIAALLFTFSWFQIEQVTGYMGMDHNDVAFTFYVTLSFWSYMEYVHTRKKYWIFIIGLFTGLGILVKWLTILIVYGCWGLSVLLKDKFKIKSYLPLVGALFICCTVFLPWQFYIIHNFPLESSYAYEFNKRHITEVLEGHAGNSFYYINLIRDQFGFFAIPLILSGSFLLIKDQVKLDYKICILISILIVYSFFSLIVKTKAPNYVYILSPFILLLFGCSFEFLDTFITKLKKPIIHFIIRFSVIIILVLSVLQFKTIDLIHEKGISKFSFVDREKKIHNTNIFKKMDSLLITPHIVFNVNGMEETEAMFYSNQNVYNWYPPKNTIDSLKSAGYRIAAFPDHGNQILPDYIKNDPAIFILPYTLK